MKRSSNRVNHPRSPREFARQTRYNPAFHNRYTANCLDMSQLRYDPIFGQWAVIAERRQSRPVEFQQFSQRRAGIDCPFCRGNESVTPPAIEAWSSTGPGVSPGEDWLIRVLPNKYPALDQSLQITGPQATTLRTASPDLESPWVADSTEFGAFQEVIVLSPRHVVSLSGLNDGELKTSFAAFQKRVAINNPIWIVI